MDIKYKVAGVPVIALVALVATIAVGSAALITTYGTSEGDVEVKQSVVFEDDTTTAGYEVEMFGGDSYAQFETIKNRSTESKAKVCFNVTQNGGNVTGLDTRVYEPIYVDTEVSFHKTHEVEGGEPIDEPMLLKATPKPTKAVYVLEFPVQMNQSPNNVDLQVDQDGDGTADFHVKWQPMKSDEEGFNDEGLAVKLYNEAGDSITDVVEPSEVAYVSADAINWKKVKIVVHGAGVRQTFGIRGGIGGSDGTGVNDEVLYKDGFQYFSTDAHQPLGAEVQSVTLEPKEHRGLAIMTAAAINIVPDNFDVDVGLNACDGQ